MHCEEFKSVHAYCKCFAVITYFMILNGMGLGLGLLFLFTKLGVCGRHVNISHTIRELIDILLLIKIAPIMVTHDDQNFGDKYLPASIYIAFWFDA